MKARWIVLGFVLVAVAVIVVVEAPLRGRAADKAPARAEPGGVVGSLGEYAISEPFTHENLTVFMIYGKDRIQGKEFLTLQEAMAKKLVTVHETGDVSNLMIENRGDKPIYVGSGEIVKGGKQDRMLQYDLIIPAHSGKMPIRSFCVEAGRWSRRGNEPLACFLCSSNVVAGKDLKLAAKSKGSQQAVWEEVAKAQRKMSVNLNATVIDPRSASSYQLSLENREVKKAVGEYMGKLARSVEGKKNAVGFAFAINGEVNSIDVYASGALFRKLWPKLLEAAAGEAIAEQKKDQAFPAAKADDVKKLIAEMAKQKVVTRRLSKRTVLSLGENSAAAYFETVDEDSEGAPVHKSYLKK